MEDFLVVKNLRKNFGKKTILSSINLSIEGGTIVGIIGQSGSGKSTFLKCLSGVFSDYEGEIKWGQNEEGKKNKSPEIGYLFQEGALFDSMDVVSNVMFPLLHTVKGYDKFLANFNKQNLSENNKTLFSHAYERACIMLERVGLSKAVSKSPSELSGGMRKRVGIARALISGPDLLLLDDPTAGLDPVTANSIMELIKELSIETKCTTIIVSHDIRRLIPRVSRVIMFSVNGMIQGDYPRERITEINSQVIHNKPMYDFISTRFDFLSSQN